VGDYRIIYEIHDAHLLVQVIRVDHRNSVYR
jgi:mRNA-degrading endonuclease RelE of RelBE toxin-antitoxin system